MKNLFSVNTEQITSKFTAVSVVEFAYASLLAAAGDPHLTFTRVVVVVSATDRSPVIAGAVGLVRTATAGRAMFQDTSGSVTT